MVNDTRHRYTNRIHDALTPFCFGFLSKEDTEFYKFRLRKIEKNVAVR